MNISMHHLKTLDEQREDIQDTEADFCGHVALKQSLVVDFCFWRPRPFITYTPNTCSFKKWEMLTEAVAWSTWCWCVNIYICILIYTYVYLYIYTYIESEGGFHRAELLQFSLHQAGAVATHRRHCLCLPVRGEQLGNARLLTPVQRNTKQTNKKQEPDKH